MIFLLVLCPILQHYKSVGVNPALGIMVVFSIYTAFKFFAVKKVTIAPVIPLFVYGLYVSVIHGLNLYVFSREMLNVILAFAVINGYLDIERWKKYYTRVAVAATIVIMIQYVCFYLLRFHLQIIPIGLLSTSCEQWYGLIRTGLIDVTGRRMSFYRPSAFFLEPSHFAIFCIPVVVSILFSSTSTKKNIKTAAFVSVGVFLTTSGLGTVIIGMCWFLYAIFYYKNKRLDKKFELRDILKFRAVILAVGFLVIFVVLYFTLGVFRQAVNRIFIADGASGHTAIEGRTATGIRSLGMLKGTRILTGLGDTISIDNWNMSGFFIAAFKFGIIGVVLFYSFYVINLFKLKGEAWWMIAIFILLSFFTAHTFSVYYKMHYTFMILQGYNNLKRNIISKTYYAVTC